MVGNADKDAPDRKAVDKDHGDASDDLGKAASQGNADATRCGFIALIGAPNAGKSTLLNNFVGSKVAIVTHKVQTTRVPLRGIAIEGASQLIFVDTPGIFEPKRRLDRAMVDSAWGGAGDADIQVLMVDAMRGIDDEVALILKGLNKRELKPAQVLLALNKVDEVAKENLLGLAQRLNEEFKFAETFFISALKGSGLSELREYLAAHVMPGPWLYPEDQITDAPLRLAAGEITREKLYLRLHQELPYASTVETQDWKELKDGSVRIEQVIYVERQGQRQIVLGKGGRAIKQISMEARKEIEEVLEQKVHLFLFVKVREKWGNDPERYRMIGLDYPKG